MCGHVCIYNKSFILKQQKLAVPTSVYHSYFSNSLTLNFLRTGSLLLLPELKFVKSSAPFYFLFIFFSKF